MSDDLAIGLIARADQGGLATMTTEFYRHMNPARTVVIDLGERGRGHCRFTRYDDGNVTINKGMDHEWPEDDVRSFCKGLAVLYSAETLYRHDVADIARSVGCRTVLHAMPELFRRDMIQPDAVWAPTDWEIARFPETTPIVPVPVAADRLPFRKREQAATFLHIAAPAMLDRNGTHIVIDALPFVTSDVKVILAGTGRRGATKIGRVRVEWANDPVENYWEQYRDEVDCLLLPRRYAGLSLPMQEAAACGIPVLSLDLAPQNEWIPNQLLAPAYPRRMVKMGGGDFWVHDGDCVTFAGIIDRLAANPDLVGDMSEAMGKRGAELSWEALAPVYRMLLAEVAGR